MTTSFLPVDIERDEGYETVAYKDTTGNVTWGVGHKDNRVKLGTKFTPAQIDHQLRLDIQAVETGLDQHLPWWRTLSDPRQDVFVNMAFNLGVDGLLTFHHTLAAVQAHNYAGAAADMLLTQPWHSQVGKRAERLAAQMRTGVRQ